MRRLGSLVVAVLSSALLFGAAQAEPLKLRVAWVASPPELIPVLFEKTGIARHLGQSYVLEPTRFAGTSPMITAFAAGEIDMAPISFSAFGQAILNAGMSDMRIIADEIQEGVEGYYNGPFMVLKNSPIRTVEDLKGKTIATNVLGTYPHIAETAMLRRHNLREGDYTVVEVQLPNMKAFLAEGKADLVFTAPIFVYDPALQEMSRPLFTMRDAMEGPTQVTFFVARAEFLAKNRAAVVDYWEDVLRAEHWYADPANHDEVVAIFARFTKLPPERLASWIYTKKDFFHNPDGLPDLATLQRNLDKAHEIGMLKSAVDIKGLTDLSVVKEAAQRLK
jgi:sulfonate transport system substrate-binding protein